MMNAQTALAARQSDAFAPAEPNRIRLHNAMNKISTALHYEFREIHSPQELEQAFRLRYRVYRASEVRHFIAENPHELDLDAYDIRAHHYGLFNCDYGGQELVGCVRVVTDHETATASAVRLIAESYEYFHHVAAEAPREVFPMLEYVPYRERILDLYRDCSAQGKEIVEAGRLALDREHQCLKLGTAVVQAAAAGFIIHNYGYALVFANYHASRFYRVGGFGLLPGSRDFHLEAEHYHGCCLLGTVGNIPALSRPTVECFAHDLRTSGKIEIFVEKAAPVEVAPTPVATTVSYYEFREVTDAAGLEELFRLRYRSFRNSKLEGLVPENEHGLDIDCYDLRARHFGLYENNGSGERLVGNHRHVTDKEQPAAAAIRKIVATTPVLQDRVLTNPEHPFPVLNYWPDKDPIYALYREATNRDELMIEASRLALDPSLDSLAVVNFVFQATVASYQVLGGTLALTVINSNRKRYYRRYGFQNQVSLPDRFIEEAQSEGSVLVWSFAETATPMQEQIARLKVEYARNGRVRLMVPQNDEEGR